MSEELRVDDNKAAAESEAETLTFTVDEVEAGARLDAYLATHVEDVSRTRLKQLIEDGEVLISDRAVTKPAYKLRAGERIEIEPPAPPLTNLIPENIPLEIVFEDEALVVVNKPAGLTVHPAAGIRSGTLANALAFKLRIADSSIADWDQRIADWEIPDEEGGSRSEDQTIGNRQSAIRNPQSLRPGIVHRLDRDTSGLIVVAKTEQAHEHLTGQFRAREVFKSYVALVHGVVREESGKIEQPLARDPSNRTRMAVVRGGRQALSLYRVRRRFDRFTLLDVEIKTGRTHQIRVHLAWLKHPVVGDKVYGGGRDQSVPDARLRQEIAALNRQFLHAEQLGFFHPRTGERLNFQAPLPPELTRLLSALAGSG
ncbi:MAG: RluA family pseudouridine synthase [Pyrinomonadaceae bacterium]